VPGALPEVEAAPLEEDLRRRDFTVNAMALRLWPEPGWQLFDPLGGRRDLASGLIRIHHARSFLDDPTRILRLARLAVRLDLREEPGTRRALDRALGSAGDVFGTISGERIRAEWELLCEEPDPPAVARWLVARGGARSLGLDAGGQRGLAALQRLHEASTRSEGAWDAELALAALLAGGSTDRAGRRLGLSGRRLARLVDLAGVGRLASTVLRARGALQLDEALSCTGPRHRCLLVAAWPETATALRWYENEVAGRPALLDGDDLLAAGLPEGRSLGEALRRVRRAQLRGDVTGKHEALALLGLAPEDR
jgi:tRNA nucleotidyltransferase (CCA-adding enzyme)